MREQQHAGREHKYTPENRNIRVSLVNNAQNPRRDPVPDNHGSASPCHLCKELILDKKVVCDCCISHVCSDIIS